MEVININGDLFTKLWPSARNFGRRNGTLTVCSQSVLPELNTGENPQL